MAHWWRAYDEAVDDPKLQTLPPALAWAWFNLMCLSSANGGVLPSIDHIAFKLRVSEAKAETLIETLQKRGLFERTDAGIKPHNWDARQFKSDVSTDRVKQHRERKRNVSPSVTRNVSSAVSVTPPETEKKEGASAPCDEEKDFFARGKSVLGERSGGLLAKLLKAQNGKVPLARAVIERASTKQNPTEYVGAVVRGAVAPGPADGWSAIL